jgi:magnesium-transporting ATPase (P-type)
VAPLAYATAISACASKGILLKGGHALDALASCDTIAFDKNGTLTMGGLSARELNQFMDIVYLDGKTRMLMLAAIQAVKRKLLQWHPLWKKEPHIPLQKQSQITVKEKIFLLFQLNILNHYQAKV